MSDRATRDSGRLSDRLRLLLLLDACEAANIAPVPIMRLHALAYLANVLGSIWSLESYDGKVLKRKGGPFYPELQLELDHLVGLGLVTIHDVEYEQEHGRWRLEGRFALNTAITHGIIDRVSIFSDEQNVILFLRRLAFTSARLDRPLEEVVAFDATWSDRRTGTGDVIDFSEWRHANYSAFAAGFFEKSGPAGTTVSRGEKLQLYMAFLQQQAHAKG